MIGPGGVEIAPDDGNGCRGGRTATTVPNCFEGDQIREVLRGAVCNLVAMQPLLEFVP